MCTYRRLNFHQDIRGGGYACVRVSRDNTIGLSMAGLFNGTLEALSASHKPRNPFGRYNY